MSMIDPRTLTNDALIETIARLAARCRQTTADLIAHLVVLEERNLHLACGFNSLWGYCHRVLGCSENGSYDRMEAAHAARRFPVVLAMLADGSLHLTSLRLLAPHLRDEDHLALLGGARRQSSRKVRELLARWFPQPDVPALVRTLPAVKRAGEGQKDGKEAEVPPESAAGAPTGGGLTTTSDTATPITGPAAAKTTGAEAQDQPVKAGSGADPADTESRPSAGAKGQTPTAAPPRRAIEPLAPGRSLVRFTGDDETVALLREAQDLLSHSIPDGDIAAIFKRALILVVADARRQRFSATKKERSATQKERSAATEEASAATEAGGGADPASRLISAEVERVVWDRDGGRCAFVGRNGWRCEARRFLEFHHLKPWIVGGPPSADNISLRCRAHNQYEATVYFAPIRAARSDAATRPTDGAGGAGPPP